MNSHHQHQATPATHAALPEGRVDGSGLLYGGVGLVLAVTMHVLNLFKGGDTRLMDLLLGSVFHHVEPNILSMPAVVAIAAAFCFGLAFAVLDTAGTWRRVVLGVTALVILLAMVPTLAVWKIYFSPFLPVVAVFWTWFCTMMYVKHHAMPCDHVQLDRGLTVEAQSSEVRLPEVETSEVPSPVEDEELVSGSVENPEVEKMLKMVIEKKAIRKQVEDANAKYKPKGN